ncbi:response regulator [Roseomonas aerophila]|uniref:histidine kinase n=1 Tax=Teichococcus aerophilus TaxID=1224513 RepID=A0ABR7RJ35_9PROT|nr:PAS domain-containing sensor histidine kinase [Pseudoroseomonas aerophila]MBC9206152.1 response regulator [Pseudoroseomonas aerophila]
MPHSAVSSPRALVYMPHGRDATIAQALLAEAQASSLVCQDLGMFEAALDDEAGFGVVTEEALQSADLRGLSARLARQPAWSDFSFIVLTRSGGGLERNPAAVRLLDILGNVTFLERPFHPTTFISLARSALRGRQRQYDARARIEALHEGESRLATALQAGRLGPWELDVEARVLAASTTCRTVFGRRQDADFGYDDLVDSIHPEDRAEVLARIRASAETGSDFATEFRTLWPDGTVHWAELRARLVRNRQAGKTRLVGVSSDVTDRKTAEDQLRRLNETLEDRVASRTAELSLAHDVVLAEIAQRERTEEQLRQSQKMEAVGQLTGGLAHDFNNLLAGITGSLELLQLRIAQGRVHEIARFVNSAQEAAARAAALTHRLLAFSRRQTLDPKTTDVSQLVAGMEDLVRRTVGPEISLEVARADNLWLTLVDPPQLENALLNLCINARDAMPDGGRLIIHASNAKVDHQAGQDHDLPAGQYVVLTVTDSGVGMTPDVMARAFDPFFTTKPLGQGTGLGLSMIYGFVRQSEGHIRIQSEVGHGTTIRLYLPRHDGYLVRMDAQSGLADAPRAEKGETVLVVDDEATVRMIVTEVLEDLGYAAVEAADGHAGLRILQSDLHIDLLVTDVGLPGGMNGRQLADAARLLRPDLRILFITGYAENAVLGQGSLHPGMHVLTKPFAMDALANRIKTLIDSRA